MNDWHETGDLDDWRVGWWFSNYAERCDDIARLDCPPFVFWFAYCVGRMLTHAETLLVMAPDFPERFDRILVHVKASRLVEELRELLVRQIRSLEQALRFKAQADDQGDAAELVLGELEYLVGVPNDG